jgi:hypothetical protein
MRVVVWSERDEPRTDHRWHDCTYASYLMALVFGGKTTFPRGIYSAAEREYLESADSRPDETGANLGDADEAVRNRYGAQYVLTPPALGLHAALAQPGFLLVVQGRNSRLPTFLRRWDPTFAGDHAVAVVPIGNDQVRWLDPEAPWRYDGDVIATSVVEAWAAGFPATRIVRADQFVPVPPAVPTMHVAPGLYTTYSAVNGRARTVGSYATQTGFTARYRSIVVLDAHGTRHIELLLPTTGRGDFRNKWFYSLAPGISKLG